MLAGNADAETNYSYAYSELLNLNTGYAGADTDLYAELSSDNNILFLAFTFINCNIMTIICIIFITVID